MDGKALITVASIIAGFGVTVLMFRLQRELTISDENWRLAQTDREVRIMPTWIPLADYLIVAAVTVALVFAILPLLMSPEPTRASLRLAATACTAATILLAGYVPAITAHYRFIYWLHKTRGPFLIGEILLVFVTIVLAIVVSRGVWIRWG